MFKQFSIQAPSAVIETELQHKIDNKTKPLGALGDLESIAFQLGKIQQTLIPNVSKPKMIVFAADHGVVAQGISLFPQEVTPQMVMNFLMGGAAVSVFCAQHNVPLRVVDVGVNAQLNEHPLLGIRKVAFSSKDFSQQAAMTSHELEKAIQAGVDEANLAIDDGVNLLMFGEMGIGNTCVSSCMMTALIGVSAIDCAGRGTGLDSAGVSHKAQVIEQSLTRAEQVTGQKRSAWSAQTLAEQVGGFEILAMAGAMLQSAERQTAFVVDGFICSVALLFAQKVAPSVRDYAIFAHQSNEKAHKLLLDHLQAEPILSLDLRLGEGSGAILAYPLIQSACLFLKNMASFESAGVSGSEQ
ncbi:MULTISPECIES: nicotinate-nucleotide--dimethylbenzimidazole phosphoribosyltransferase [Marinomonas]|uniref:Nicotinate-nucleotide--dimethylbenzimidazole phosphoribosyltransferase n=1 Tax=Marinomonas arctica TaxID=383750 RepID=A0A7H1J9I6_9GAMM|nr:MULTISPECIES: nicotinate-nucleotide--dimethylbenzimidazole phosphoribosyltransferase [Marinomonas]QNT07152.1 nicotinate-nucleotide--dimethylbenzimidazole phosphoribosyltransferase [Marinomonas arctica]GGN24222.1 nicotinate-nucleotide--dimethylbenzimidazole phosphoribosyltransferase [Marinomonas arctica]